MSVNPAFMNPADPLGVQLLNGEVSRQAGMIAYDSVFGMMMLIVVLMVPLLLLVRPPAKQAPIHVEAMD
jgi:DHA2 family multidrug resistance protein